MILYLLSKDNLSIKAVQTLSSYEFKEDIDFGDSSSIVVADYLQMEDGDYALIKDGEEQVFFGICQEMKPSDTGYTITLKQKETLFDTTIFNDGEGLIQAAGMEDYIAKAIMDNFIASGDALMDMDYIQVTARTHTKVAARVSTIVDAENGVYNLKTFLGNARQNYGIFLDFTVSNGAINIDITNRAQTALNIDTKLPEVTDLSETYSIKVLAKLVVKWDTPKEYASEESVQVITERVQIDGRHNNKVILGDAGWTSLQSENPDNGNMYRLQLQKDGTVTFYSSTDGGATWNTKTAVFNHQVLFNRVLQAYDGKNSRNVLWVYDDGDTENYGSEVILEGGGNMYVGSGESATGLHNALGVSSGGTTYLTSDNSVVLVSNCQTIANRKVAYLSASALYPGSNGAFTLGTASLRWGQIYSTASSISTSDRSQKHDEMELDEERATALIMGARPVTYKYNDGTSGRTHWGLIAQDVESLLDTMGIDAADFAGFVKSKKEQVDERTGELSPVLDKDGNPIYEYGLRYEEFVAPIIKTSQRQERKTDDLERRVSRLENIVRGLIDEH